MHLKRIEIEGFRSFKEREAFDFTTQVGVVRLGGLNEDEPSLGANGAGKTSLWEAVYWAMYGKTATGLKGPEVVSWGKTKCRVVLHLNGAVLIRSWGGKISITVDGEDRTQEQVDEWLGLNAEQALYCSYIAQHASTFLDLGAQAKTDLLSSILNLDYWLDRSKGADKALDQCSDSLRVTSIDLGKKEGSVETLMQTDYEKQDMEWTSRKDENISLLNLDRKQTSKEFDALTQTLEEQREDLDNAKHTADHATASLGEAQAEVRHSLNAVLQAEAQVKALQHTLNGCDKDTCPVCSQPWPKAMRNKAANVKEELAAAKAKVRPLDSKLKEKEWIEKAKALKLSDAIEQYDKLKEAVRDTLNSRKGLQDRLEYLSAALKKASKEESPYADLIKEKKRRLASLHEEIERLKKEQQTLEVQAARLTYWVKGFKDVRLFLVAEALTHLEVEVNSALMQLGLAEWSIKFAPDSETKAGAVKRGFSVMIESPSNQHPVPWAVWSGGEAQRLRLAATMGLSNLIASYTGYHPFIEVFDEASSGLSEEGVEDFLQALNNRAVEEDKQIWVVDHQALESGVFCETVMAIKADGTTKLKRVANDRGE